MILNGIFFEGDQGKFEVWKKSSAMMQTPIVYISLPKHPREHW